MYKYRTMYGTDDEFNWNVILICILRESLLGFCSAEFDAMYALCVVWLNKIQYYQINIICSASCLLVIPNTFELHIAKPEWKVPTLPAYKYTFRKIPCLQRYRRESKHFPWSWLGVGLLLCYYLRICTSYMQYFVLFSPPTKGFSSLYNSCSSFTVSIFVLLVSFFSFYVFLTASLYSLLVFLYCSLLLQCHSCIPSNTNCRVSPYSYRRFRLLLRLLQKIYSANGHQKLISTIRNCIGLPE